MVRTIARQEKKQDISSVEENKALVKSAIEEVFNQRNVSAADKYIAEDLINNNPLAGQGREPLKQYFEKVYFTAFPDSQTVIEQIGGEDDRVLIFLLAVDGIRIIHNLLLPSPPPPHILLNSLAILYS